MKAIVAMNRDVAVPEAESVPSPVVIGLDDGYSHTKIALPDGRLVSVPSSARRGPAHRTWLNGRSPSIAEYVTQGEVWSAGDIHGESTQFADYPHSLLNRIVVQHALQTAGLSGSVAELASGLPVSAFYDSQGQRRATFIESKSSSLAIPVNPQSATPPASVGFNTVIPEALAAWYDFVITEDNGEPRMEQSRVRGATAVVDIGGRTTDFVVVSDQAIDHARSGSIACGLLDVERAVTNSLRDRYGLERPTRSQVQAALKSGRIRLFGKDQNLEDQSLAARSAVLGQIRDECRRKLGTAAELDCVLFAGGGAVALAEALVGWFPHQVTASAATFANARGMLKFMRHVATRPNSSVATAAQ